VPSDSKVVTVELLGSNNKTATATNPKNWQGTAQLPPEPPSGRRGEDSVDSDNISSSVSLQPHRGGKHSGICTVVYVTFKYNFNFYLPDMIHVQYFSHHKGLFTVVCINAGP
jgi:hypothetical protein